MTNDAGPRLSLTVPATLLARANEVIEINGFVAPAHGGYWQILLQKSVEALREQ